MNAAIRPELLDNAIKSECLSFSEGLDISRRNVGKMTQIEQGFIAWVIMVIVLMAVVYFGDNFTRILSIILLGPVLGWCFFQFWKRAPMHQEIWKRISDKEEEFNKWFSYPCGTTTKVVENVKLDLVLRAKKVLQLEVVEKKAREELAKGGSLTPIKEIARSVGLSSFDIWAGEDPMEALRKARREFEHCFDLAKYFLRYDLDNGMGFGPFYNEAQTRL